MTTTENYAIFGMSPSAVIAAAGQVNSGAGTSLLANSDFMEQLPGRGAEGAMAGVHSVDWVNTPRLMRDGYSAVALLCSGLSNAVRSPKDQSRSAGLILPPMNALAAGAKGMVSVGRVVGNDLRAEMRGDRSQLVNATGIMGYMANSPVGPLVAAMFLGSAVAPRIAQAEQQAMRVQHEMELRDLEVEAIRRQHEEQAKHAHDQAHEHGEQHEHEKQSDGDDR